MFNIVDKNVLLDNNNTYKIVYSIDIRGRNVYYLININDFSDIKFCYMLDDNMLGEIRSKDELTEIIEIFGRRVAIFLK